MKCPVCPETTLLMTDRQGVEIDYCPNCRGVWLDRGELDKLLQLGAQHEMAASPPAASASRPGARRDFEDSDFGRRHGGHRRKSWLSDIFD
jgi:Zn-finger nucleic acid-binding protein